MFAATGIVPCTGGDLFNTRRNADKGIREDDSFFACSVLVQMFFLALSGQAVVTFPNV